MDICMDERIDLLKNTAQYWPFYEFIERWPDKAWPKITNKTAQIRKVLTRARRPPTVFVCFLVAFPFFSPMMRFTSPWATRLHCSFLPSSVDPFLSLSLDVVDLAWLDLQRTFDDLVLTRAITYIRNISSIKLTNTRMRRDWVQRTMVVDVMAMLFSWMRMKWCLTSFWRVLMNDWITQR